MVFIYRTSAMSFTVSQQFPNLPFDIHSHDWGPDDAAAVASLFGEELEALILRRVERWLPHLGMLKRTPWFQEEDDCSRSTVVGLRQASTLRGARDPDTGAWLGEADDLFRHQIRRIILSTLPRSKRPIGKRTTAGLLHQKPKRPPRPRTPAELEGLRKGRETMRARRKELSRDREEASASSRSESSSAIHEDSAVS
jgi:hypothetical protein